MKNLTEIKMQRRKIKGIIGYGLMWLFVAFLTGILPFMTGNDNFVFYFVGLTSLITAIYQLSRGAKKLYNN